MDLDWSTIEQTKLSDEGRTVAAEFYFDRIITNKLFTEGLTCSRERARPKYEAGRNSLSGQ